MTNSVTRNNRSGVMFFCFPYAPLVPVKQAETLIECISDHCSVLYVVGDSRINLNTTPLHIRRLGRIPTLHHVGSIRPMFWSVILSALKLIWILIRASIAVIEVRKQVDTILCYKSYYYTPILLVAKLLGMRTIVYLPNNEVDAAQVLYNGRLGYSALITILTLLQKTNHYLADICVVQSMRLVERLQLENLTSKVRLGTLFVDTNKYNSLVPVENRPLTLGFVGRLNPQKGILQLLEAFALVNNKNKEVQLNIVGEGVLLDEIEKSIKDLGLSTVKLFGWADQDVLIQHLNSFRLLILPSLNEGIPNIVLESMACNTPVLATNIDGIPDLIQHNETGFLITDLEPKTIADAINHIIEDADLSKVASKARQHISKNYSLHSASTRWQNILAEE